MRKSIITLVVFILRVKGVEDEVAGSEVAGDEVAGDVGWLLG